MKIIIGVVVSLTIIGCSQDRLVKARNPNCGARCYTGDFLNAGVGECHFGKLDCGDDPTNDNPVCVGSILPSAQQCNGLDNDCDGTVDAPITACSTQCGLGLQSCNVACTAKQPQPETCNGKDDDCNGMIDDPASLPVQFCYSGPMQTAGVGECRPGVVRCIGGKPSCFGDVLPKLEKCDGLDNDCDGTPDNGVDGGSPILYDFVFIVDNSCSMGGVISKLQNVSSGWAAKYSSSNYQFGLVTAPDPDFQYGEQVRLYANLGSAQAFGAAMANQGITGSGSEPTLDAVWMVLSQNNPLNISWRQGAMRGVVLFTDEYPQSYNFSPSLTEAQVGSIVNLAQVPITAFVDSATGAAWPTAIPAPYGKVMDIYMSTINMDAELDKFILQRGCQ